MNNTQKHEQFVDYVEEMIQYNKELIKYGITLDKVADNHSVANLKILYSQIEVLEDAISVSENYKGTLKSLEKIRTEMSRGPNSTKHGVDKAINRYLREDSKQLR